MFSEVLHWWVRKPFTRTEHILCIPRQNYGRGLWPCKIDLSTPSHPTSHQINILVYYFWHCMSLHVCPGNFFFILDSRLAIFWERNCPFGFLLVVFWLWCSCYKCVLLSLWCLGQKMLGNCIEYWSLPSFLFVSSKIYDKSNDFDFDIVNIPLVDGDVPCAPFYCAYISQLIRFARVSSHLADFNVHNKKGKRKVQGVPQSQTAALPRPKRKRKPTNPNKHKSNKRTKSTKISSLFPKRGNRNTKRTKKHKNKMTRGKTYNKSPRRINHKATKSKTNTGTTA